MRVAGDSDGRVVRERLARVVGLPQIGDDPPLRPETPSPPPDTPPEPAAVSAPSGRGGFAALNPGRRGVRVLALLAALAVAVAGATAWFARPRVEPVPVRVETSVAPEAPGATVGAVVVAVHGRVRRPGLVRLPVGARVADAIDAAGGALPGTDLSFVNLARKLVDGELILVGVTPPPGVGDAAPGGGADPAAPVNLNTATAAQLETLPGVGPTLARRIIDYRNRHGGFRTVSELRQVDGVGDVRYAQLKDLVCV